MAKHSRKQFKKMVERAIESLPELTRDHIKNVAVCVQDQPNLEQLRETGVRRDDVLLGLFEGVPETEWGKGFGNVLPDKITIFQQGIEQFADTPEEIEQEVRDTVRHEIAHHFGFTEAELEKRENMV